MKAWVLKFWDDPAFFALVVRSTLAGVALAVQSGALDLGRWGWWLSIPAFAGSLLIKAGDKNQPLLDQIKALTPAEAAELKAHLR